MQPQKLQRLLQEALSHLQASRLEAAARLCAEARAGAPRDFNALHLAGLIALQQGRAADAAAALAAARRINARSASTVMCLGVALLSLGRRAEAEAAVRDALKLAPDSAETWGNLGTVLVADNRHEEAIAAFRRAIELKPSSAGGWTGLGAVLLLTGRAGEAIGYHTRALELEPAHPKAQFSRAQALLACHRPTEALADFDAHLARQPDHHEARSYRLFALNYLDTLSREQLFAEHRAFARALENSLAARPAVALRNSSDLNRRIRLAFISPDLRRHSVAFFLEPILRHLDRSRFDVRLYHDHPSVDAVSLRLREMVDGWKHVVGLSADTLEAAIRADAPDVLVDLAGHTGLNRLPLFARRLAPVQLAYLGYPNTTGLAAMDYRFTDAVADPSGEAEALHSEQLVRFAPTAWAYQAPADAPAPAAPPCARAEGAPFTFGSFNALSKISPATLRLWREVLVTVPGSRLALKSGGMEPPACLRRLAEHGIPRERVVLLPHTKTIAEHLACYAELDVALDPFPCNGTTATCEALWMGVPVVTLAGDRHAARVGASLLTAIGRPEWIAASPDDYVRIASELAADAVALTKIRATLRGEVARSPLGDHAAQADRFGTAVAVCWKTWCMRIALPVAV